MLLFFPDFSERAESPMEARPESLVGEEHPGVGVGSATAAEIDRHKALSEEARKVYNDLQLGRCSSALTGLLNICIGGLQNGFQIYRKNLVSDLDPKIPDS